MAEVRKMVCRYRKLRYLGNFQRKNGSKSTIFRAKCRKIFCFSARIQKISEIVVELCLIYGFLAYFSICSNRYFAIKNIGQKPALFWPCGPWATGKGIVTMVLVAASATCSAQIQWREGVGIVGNMLTKHFPQFGADLTSIPQDIAWNVTKKWSIFGPKNGPKRGRYRSFRYRRGTFGKTDLSRPKLIGTQKKNMLRASGDQRWHSEIGFVRKLAANIFIWPEQVGLGQKKIGPPPDLTPYIDICIYL
jgi:hypothetical protein